jgi:hypothetical protein
MDNVLGDGKGIECVRCKGACSIGDMNCPDCEGQGRIEPDRTVIENLDDIEDYREVIHLIYGLRERPMIPSEWLNQPAKFCAAYLFLSRHILEFDKRKEDAAKPD